VDSATEGVFEPPRCSTPNVGGGTRTPRGVKSMSCGSSDRQCCQKFRVLQPMLNDLDAGPSFGEVAATGEVATGTYGRSLACTRCRRRWQVRH